jgi:uncharacterized protein
MDDARSHAAPRVRYLVLWLTTACNLRCAYCYRGEQPVATMPLEVARAALELAAASKRPFHVQLAGGEPTLELQLVEAIGALVRRRAWPATVAIQTNGTLIQTRLIDVCRRNGITVGISLDGPPAVQARTRGMAGATFRGLGLLATHAVPVRVTTVLSSANAATLNALAFCLAPYPNVRGFGLDPVVNKGAAGSSPDLLPSPEAVGDGVRQLLTAFHLINRSRKNRLQWREWDAVCRAMGEPRPIKPFCHACRGESLAVHPDGTVYPCGQTIGDPAMAAGTLDAVDWNRLKGVYRDVRLTGDCGPCPLDGRCPGDCPSRLSYNSSVSPQPMCLVYQAIAADLKGTPP